MPEGDTVWHTAATLRQHLAGRTLTRCDIRVPRFATVDLTGQVVDEVLSRGKHLFIRVGPASIHSHLKMDGSWRVGNRPVKVDHRARIILEANEVRAVGVDLGVLDDPRPRPRRRRGRAPGTRSAGRGLGSAGRRGEFDGAPGPPDGRGAAGPAGAGRGGQRLLQRIVFRQRTSAHRAGQRGHRPGSACSLAPGTCCGSTASAGTAAPPATPEPAGSCGSTGEPASLAVAAAPASQFDDTAERVAYWCPACQR